MPKVMIQRDRETGDMTLYIPKKDLEENVTSLEFDEPDKWGGEVTLADGSVYVLDLLDKEPKLPITLRAKRG